MCVRLAVIHILPLQEVKQRALLNNKLTPILIGINHDGVVRVDPKTKEVGTWGTFPFSCP